MAEPGPALNTNIPTSICLPSVQYLLGGGISPGQPGGSGEWQRPEWIHQRRQRHPTPVLQYSCLENPTYGGVRWAAVHGVAKSGTRLSDFTFTFHFHALEKEMAPYSSVFAWRISGTGEPFGLPSMGSHRVRHDWSKLAAPAAADFNSMWTENFQMFKLDLEKAEESEIKFPTSVGWSKKAMNSRKTPASGLLTMPKPWTVWITPYSSTLTWKIPWTGEPGGLPSMGSHRVGHDWSDLAAAAVSDQFFSKRFESNHSNREWCWLPWT